MTGIEKIVGTSHENLREYEWPTPKSAQSYFLSPAAPPRGSVRLRAGRIVGRDEIDKKWNETVAELREAF